ncbi:nonstructural protein [Sigmofec virus UA08Rod_5349]|uniref:Nonstructural protein n=1 Tax=Sigmofec virus UA08Rod_5349 TaxID=2929421 RepID=A0A976N1H9_9VIRU|nr:nonstructural protein [Sigmofec virus UA08Rod_5349]
MILSVYSIRDCKSGFLRPSVDINDLVAIRAFSHAVVNSPDVLSSYCKDFDLYQIATFDDETGEISPIFPPAHIISGPDAFRQLAGSGGDV